MNGANAVDPQLDEKLKPIEGRDFRALTIKRHFAANVAVGA